MVAIARASSPAILSGKHLRSEAETRIRVSAMASANILAGGGRFPLAHGDSAAEAHVSVLPTPVPKLPFRQSSNAMSAVICLE